ncbi:MAG TPA: GAF domain-containing protein [Blastocatellia bacterium]|nr:GAF domain-containing protein [Blastocatellia bacterium]
MAEGKTQQATDESERLGHIYELALTVAGNPVEVFDHIVKIIAELFGVRVALVERVEGDKAITLSMYLDGRVLHEGVFEVAGTPRDSVREARSFCAFNAAAEQFPRDRLLRDYDLGSYVGVPVVSSGGEVIATISAMHDRPFHLAGEDRLFLEAMASRVRLELEHFDQASEAQMALALLDISREISRVREIDETLQIVVNRAREFLGVDIAAIATADDDAGTTSWKATAGFKTETHRATKFAPGRGVAGRAIAARQTVVVEGAGERDDLPAEEFPISMAEGVRNCAGVPLMIGPRAVGVLIAGHRSDKKFTESSIRFAETIASQAAIAIENARLFTKLAAANQRLLEADQHKTEMIAELSTPIIPIWDHVLLAPIIGTLNAERTEAMTDALLQKMAGGGADVMILDITGVRNIDTDAAQHLRNMVSAVRVLGGRCIITGIRGSIAQTLVHLGITLEDIETRRKLSDALQLAMDFIKTSH